MYCFDISNCLYSLSIQARLVLVLLAFMKVKFHKAFGNFDLTGIKNYFRDKNVIIKSSNFDLFQAECNNTVKFHIMIDQVYLL